MKADEALKAYLSDNARYADLINGMVFGGRQVVKPEDLSEMDSQVTVLDAESAKCGPVSRESDACNTSQRKQARRRKNNRPKYRDLIRRTAFGVNFAVIAVENQSHPHYLMPLRVMDYDAKEYLRQAKQISKHVEALAKTGHGKDSTYIPADPKPTSAEYLSRFRRSDRLHPCVTLILFYGEHWDGSQDLHGILDFTDIPEEMKVLVNNYHIHLLEIRSLKQTAVYRTDIKQVFDFIRYADDKQKLRELVQHDPAYQHMDSDAYDVAVEFTGAMELITTKNNYLNKEEVNMCKALTEMLQDERALGREEGLEWGIAQGIEQGIEQGTLITLYALIQKGRLTISEAAEEVNMCPADFEALMLQSK